MEKQARDSGRVQAVVDIQGVNSLLNVDHSEKRKQVYSQIDRFFPNLHNEEYALLDIHLLEESDCIEIRTVTKRLGSVFRKAMDILRHVDATTLVDVFGIPEAAIPVLKLKTIQAESVIARVDLVKTDEGYKMLEINADTPTFIVENYYANQFICHYYSVNNPNEGNVVPLTNAIRRAIAESSHYISNPKPHIVFTSHKDHEEDRLTTEYLLERSGMSDVSYVALEDLQISEDGLFDSHSHKIDILYRQTYPLEYLVEDQDPNDGKNIGSMLLDLVKRKKLAIINPPSAFLMQSKAVQAAIWGLYEHDSPVFTSEEKRWIHDYMLPTYLDPDMFLGEKGGKFVKKPSFGREGNTVEIIDPQGNTLFEEKTKLYKDSLPVYQKYVDLPKITIQTEQGRKQAHLLIGCFLVDGEPGAIGLRAGGQITDNGSYYLPVGLKK